MCVVQQDDLEGKTTLDLGDYRIAVTEFDSGRSVISVVSNHDGRIFEIAEIEAEPRSLGIELYGEEGRITVGKFKAPYDRRDE